MLKIKLENFQKTFETKFIHLNNPNLLQFHEKKYILE